MKKFFVPALILSLSTAPSFAACEKEKEAYSSAQSACEGWGKASGIVGTIGCILIPGVGGLLGGIPAAVAVAQANKAEQLMNSILELGEGDIDLDAPETLQGIQDRERELNDQLNTLIRRERMARGL